MTEPILSTAVVGSYSVPEWLERLKDDHLQRRVSADHLEEIHQVAIKAALKDQEQAGINVVSDGELRRDNDIDYLLSRIPGVTIANRTKLHYFDYLHARIERELPHPVGGSLALADEYRFTAEYTDRPIQFSFTGPFSLSRHIENDAYRQDRDLVLALADWLNAEAHALVAAGARLLQIDEPFLAGHPEEVDVAIEAINRVVAGVEANWALHVCYGNRHARPLWEGHYSFLFPAVLEARVDRLTLEFARKGYDDLALLAEHDWDRQVGLGVIDVKNRQVETPELVAGRIRRSLDLVAPDRLMVNPDCGLRHLPTDIARAKLRAMVDGAALVRSELTGHADQHWVAAPVDLEVDPVPNSVVPIST
jgi:5-methyltetrahydropteroyltriglutamate--homocysteine methyltransferase